VVRAETPDGEVHGLAIVGEDEAGTAERSISFRSPIGGRRARPSPAATASEWLPDTEGITGHAP
jgi:hypothetical protein